MGQIGWKLREVTWLRMLLLTVGYFGPDYEWNRTLLKKSGSLCTSEEKWLAAHN